MSTVKFTIETEAGEAVQAQIKLEEGQKKIEAATVQTTRAYNKQEKAAKRMLASMNTPLENYNKKLSALNLLLKRGAIDQSTYEKKVKQATDELRRQTGETRKLEEANRRAAVEQKKLGDEGKRVFDSVRTPLERHNFEVRRMGMLLRRGAISQDTYTRAVNQSKAALKESQTAGRGAFGQAALSNLKSYALGMVGIGSAVSGVIQLLREARRIQDDSADRITDQSSGIRALRQVAGGDETKFNALTAFADRLRTDKGYTPTESLRAAFQAGSAGDRFLTPESFEVLAQLREINFDPDKAISSAQKIQASFGVGAAGGGNFREIINKILAAAGPSPVKASEIATAAAAATQNFSAIGGSDEQLLAMMGVFAESTKSPEAAGEQLNSIATQILKKQAKGQIDLSGRFEGIGGLDLIRALPELEAEGRLRAASTRNARGELVPGRAVSAAVFLEESNALKAFNTIMGREAEIDERLASVRAAEAQTGGGRDLLLVSSSLSNTKADAVLFAERAKQGRELSEENRFAQITSIVNALQDQIVEQKTGGGSRPIMIATGRAVRGAERFIRGDEAVLRRDLELSFLPDRSGGVDRSDLLRDSPQLQDDAARALGASAVEFLRVAREMREALDQEFLTPLQVGRAQREAQGGIRTSTTPTSQGE